MIQLTDTDGDAMLIREEHISLVVMYRPNPDRPERKFTRTPASVIHTITGAAIPVLETPHTIADQIRGFPTNESY